MKINLKKAQSITRIIWMLGVLACLLSIVYLIITKAVIRPNLPKPVTYHVFMWGMPISGFFGLMYAVFYFANKRSIPKKLAAGEKIVIGKDIKIPANKFS